MIRAISVVAMFLLVLGPFKAGAETFCGPEEFSKFLLDYSRLSKKEQMAYVTFPLKVTESFFGGSDQVRLAGPDYFDDYNKKRVMTSTEVLV